MVGPAIGYYSWHRQKLEKQLQLFETLLVPFKKKGMQGSIKSFFGRVSLSVIKWPQINSRVNCTCIILHATKPESMKMDLEIKR